MGRHLNKKLRVADFFCGAGGFSEGFRQVGFDICFAVDNWAPAVETYRANKPYCNVIQDDVVRISKLPDDEFEKTVPDTEIIIGSPPCVAFSNSNKSGNGDKQLGIILLEAYLRIVARKKFKQGSILKYWILENVPNLKKYIKEQYTPKDLGLEGDFILSPLGKSSGVYNAKYFGAPTNRKRFICGDFPEPQNILYDNELITLRKILDSLGEPLDSNKSKICDYNYPDLVMDVSEVTDHQYIYAVEPFEWEVAKRLKQDKGYMGKMSFPENIDKPARTVMATMSCRSRESMILANGKNKYRLPTVREVASMMSFPIDYRFYGSSKGIKHTLVGNAVPPKLSRALAITILGECNEPIPTSYPRILHDSRIPFIDLNYTTFPKREECLKLPTAKFKYHIPYLIVNSYRVELTNYHSDFINHKFTWDVELHHGQGKKSAKKFTPNIDRKEIPLNIIKAIDSWCTKNLPTDSYDDFQKIFCLTSVERKQNKLIGPYELLDSLRRLIDSQLPIESFNKTVLIMDPPHSIPLVIQVGYYALQSILYAMKGGL